MFFFLILLLLLYMRASVHIESTEKIAVPLAICRRVDVAYMFCQWLKYDQSGQTIEWSIIHDDGHQETWNWGKNARILFAYNKEHNGPHMWVWVYECLHCLLFYMSLLLTLFVVSCCHCANNIRPLGEKKNTNDYLHGCNKIS